MRGASWGLQFLVAFLESRDYTCLSRSKIQEELFRPEERQLYHFIRQWYEDRRTYGSFPPMEELDCRFPTLHLSAVEVTQPLDVLANLLHRNLLSAKLKEEAMMLSSLADSDPYAGMERMRLVSYELQQKFETAQNDLILSESSERITHELELVLSAGGLVGFPFPWEALNRATMGIRPGAMIGFFGRPKTEKSHLKICIAAHLYERGYRVLFVNTEMNLEDLEMRAAMAIEKLPYMDSRFRPTPELIARLRGSLQSLSEEENLFSHAREGRKSTFICTDDVQTLADLRAKIEVTKPDVVFVDSAHELSPGKEFKTDERRQTELARGIRRITKDRKLGRPPILFSIHANRTGDQHIAKSYSELAGSDQWGKTCDLVLRLVKFFHPQHNRVVLGVLPPESGGREVVWEGMLVGAQPYNGMEFLQEVTAAEVAEWMNQEKEESGARLSRRQRQRAPATTQAPEIATVPWAASLPDDEC